MAATVMRTPPSKAPSSSPDASNTEPRNGSVQHDLLHHLALKPCVDGLDEALAHVGELLAKWGAVHLDVQGASSELHGHRAARHHAAGQVVPQAGHGLLIQLLAQPIGVHQ